MKTLLFIAIACSLFISCLPGLDIAYLSYTRRNFTNYKIGEERSCSVGDVIVEGEVSPVLDAYEVLFDYQPPTKGVTHDEQPFMTKGDRFTVVGIDSRNSNSLLLKPEGATGNPLLVHIFPDGRVNKGWIYSQGLVAAQGDWTKQQLFQKSSSPSRGQGSFRAQIIYSGLLDKTLRAVYREFADDYARPAFSQELQYNLDESKVIAYRNLRIEVLRATNTALTYKVLEDGNLQWIKR